MPYTFNDHRHRYAIWTAARAVQRNFSVKIEDIKVAVENANLRGYVEGCSSSSRNDFDFFQKASAASIIDTLENKNIQNASYGRASKIIAVYLKTALVLCNNAACQKSEVIHPPLDRILLQKLSKEVHGLQMLAKYNWTMLDSDNYWKIVELVRSKVGWFNWRVEEFWELGVDADK
ncbi:hypothetical protein [Chitinophaga sp.]|uniref:hypothetical protein n=1 Tax=Chitinophaga sp. TaxID=1869181 RepID=UPI0031D9FA5C